MGNQDQSARGFNVDRYLQSQAELRTLKSRLPGHAVQSLAREVITRLAARDYDEAVPPTHDEDIQELCHALISEDDFAGARYIADLRLDGATTEAAYLTYLTGAARLLGEWWEADKVPFTATALGTTRMYAIMRALRRDFPLTDVPKVRSAVFVSVPGETHVLGVRMAADLFRKVGWDIDLLVDKTHDELVKDISQSGALLVGISAGGDHMIEPLSKLVIALRLSNPLARIIISGNIAEDARAAIDLLDVDGVTTNVEEAMQVMTSIWDDPDRPEADAL